MFLYIWFWYYFLIIFEDKVGRKVLFIGFFKFKLLFFYLVKFEIGKFKGKDFDIKILIFSKELEGRRFIGNKIIKNKITLNFLNVFLFLFVCFDIW